MSRAVYLSRADVEGGLHIEGGYRGRFTYRGHMSMAGYLSRAILVLARAGRRFTYISQFYYSVSSSLNKGTYI
jgi:hypothetical protein